MFEILLIVATIILSGFFSGSEIGFISANRLRLELKAREDSVRGRYLHYFVRNPETYLSATLVGNNIVNVAYATLMTLFLAIPIANGWITLFGTEPGEYSVLIIQTVLASVIILIFGEIIPKSIFRIHSDRLISFVVVPLGFTHAVLKPLIWIATSIARKLIRIFQPDTESVEKFFHRDEIELLFREVGVDSEGELDQDDSEILSNVLELSTKRVRETMIPRTDISAAEIDSTLEEVLEMFVSSGYSKLPVYDGNIDNIVGMIFAYDLFKRPKSLQEIIRPIKHVPSSQKSTDLLSEFRRLNVSMAVVIDEYGGTAGLITIEDLIEEVVGDIQDEYDMEETIMKKLPDNSYVLSGDVEIEDIEEEFPEIGLRDEDCEYETIAGFVINSIGRIPKIGEEVFVGNRKIIITKATPTRIEIIRIILMDQ
jgi:putative hemolysin